MTAVRTPNELAWQRYMGSQPFQCHREDFDHGWDAGYNYAINVEHAERHQMTLLIGSQERLIATYEALLERWAHGGARGEAIDLAEETEDLLEARRAT